VICLRCGNENDATFQHCVHCGASLAAPAPERRKLATLVFCDLSGSTAMGEHADAETVRGLMLAYFEEMRVALERHGGTVEKFVGDAVLAVFGVPEAHEDDALRACRAALEMKERAEILNEDLQRRFGTRIALRLGVNTGEVIAGDPSSRQTFVTGDAVNVAARLEQAAQGGEVLIGDPTYRLVRGAVRVEAVEPLSAKGKSEPVPAYRLLEVTAVGPAARRLGTPFTGREAELALLERELEAVVSECECRPVTIVGEPGVGKSRLVAEFVERVGGRARVVRGTCLSYGEGITYWAIGQIVRELARVTDGHSPREARALIESLVAGLPNGTAVATNVAQLLGLADGAATADETAAAIRDVLAAGAREEPLVVVVDDIQWAEPTLLDLLACLPERLAEAPIMLLCLARPELPEHRPDWQATVHLEPFVGHDVDSLLEALLGAAPADVRARLAAASGGNPLFVEELVAMLEDEGVLRVAYGICTGGPRRARHLGGGFRVAAAARLPPRPPRGVALSRREGWRRLTSRLSSDSAPVLVDERDPPDPCSAGLLRRLAVGRGR
jgi:class 3 adenylate cyclase